jgi:hypothetical protein
LTSVAVAHKTLSRRQLLCGSVVVSACSSIYALYRGVGMIGTPTSESSWRASIAGAAVVLLLVALLLFAALPLCPRPAPGLRGRLLGWILAARSRSGRRWLTGALAAVAVLTGIGLLSAFGVVGRAIMG